MLSVRLRLSPPSSSIGLGFWQFYQLRTDVDSLQISVHSVPSWELVLARWTHDYIAFAVFGLSFVWLWVVEWNWLIITNFLKYTCFICLHFVLKGYVCWCQLKNICAIYVLRDKLDLMFCDNLIHHASICIKSVHVLESYFTSVPNRPKVT